MSTTLEMRTTVSIEVHSKSLFMSKCSLLVDGEECTDSSTAQSDDSANQSRMKV